MKKSASQNDTLHLHFHYAQFIPHDTTLSKTDLWLRTLNGRHVNLNLVAYYHQSDFKKAAEARLDELFLVLNRKAREQITIETMEPKKGKTQFRIRVDIVYTFADGRPAPVKQKGPAATTIAQTRKTGASPQNERTRNPEEKNEKVRSHVVKINLSQLGLRNLSAQYEFVFHKRLSVALGLSYLTPRRLSSFVDVFSVDTQKDAQGREVGYVSPVLSGWAATPELRFYPFGTRKNKAPHGFYLAPYARLSQFSMTSIYSEYYDGITYRLNFTSRYRCLSGGLMLGTQWLLGKRKRVSLDWWIFGLGAGLVRPSMEGSATNVNMSPKVQKDVKKEVENRLQGFQLVGFKKPAVETSNNSFKVTLSDVPFVTARGMGICIGFVF